MNVRQGGQYPLWFAVLSIMNRSESDGLLSCVNAQDPGKFIHTRTLQHVCDKKRTPRNLSAKRGLEFISSQDSKLTGKRPSRLE